MRLSRLALATTKETPADAEIVSHQLMLRAGMIRRLGAGLYTWSPLGMRVLRKVEAIIRAEMAAIDALEILMPAVQPAELWQESGRWQAMGPLMLRMTDRAEPAFENAAIQLPDAGKPRLWLGLLQLQQTYYENLI